MQYVSGVNVLINVNANEFISVGKILNFHEFKAKLKSDFQKPTGFFEIS